MSFRAGQVLRHKAKIAAAFSGMKLRSAKAELDSRDL
jgi:hypothetical protein